MPPVFIDAERNVNARFVGAGIFGVVGVAVGQPVGAVRAVLAENLIAAGLGLEVASGNDAMSSHSEMRKAAKLMLQFLPGTDFITSGYSSMPRRDNMFGGGNFGTSTIANEFYRTTFVQSRSGLGAALAVLLFVLVIPIIILNRKAQKRAEEMVGA